MLGFVAHAGVLARRELDVNTARAPRDRAKPQRKRRAKSAPFASRTIRERFARQRNFARASAGGRADVAQAQA